MNLFAVINEEVGEGKVYTDLTAAAKAVGMSYGGLKKALKREGGFYCKGLIVVAECEWVRTNRANNPKGINK